MNVSYEDDDRIITFSGKMPENGIHVLDYIRNKEKTKIIRFVNCDTSDTTSFWDMFNRCDKIEHIEGLETFDTSNVEYMMFIFAGCESLKEIHINNWNVKNVLFIAGAFSRCHSLKEIDLSNWEFDREIDAESMFHDCRNVEYIDKKKVRIKQYDLVSGMFSNCPKLKCVRTECFFGDHGYEHDNIFDGCPSLAPNKMKFHETRDYVYAYIMKYEFENIKNNKWENLY